MAFTELADLDCSETTALGGRNSKTGKPNPTKIEGFYIGTRKVDSPKSKTGEASLHIFQTQKGNIGIWGKTNLDQKIKSVLPGAMTRVTFVGMVETKNNPMYKYKVEVDLDNTINVADAIAESAAAYGSEYSDDSSDDLDAVSYSSEPAVEEAPPARRAAAPSAASQERVRQLLNGNRAKT